jgi:hypothetical protein
MALALVVVWLASGGRPPDAKVIATSPATASKTSATPAPPGRAARTSTNTSAGIASLAVTEREGLRQRLQESMRQHPEDARIPAALARMSFEDRRYREGLGLFRQAVKRDPTLRGDPVLLRHVIDGLEHDRFAPAGEEFLRGARKQARPLLAEAARQHESPRVRQRAKALLRERAEKPFLRWR